MAKIYALTNLKTQFAYIGCTKASVNKRMREHRCLLNQSKHTELLLQADWKEYGSENFLISILEALPSPTLSDRRSAELKWMNTYSEAGKLYNTNMTSFSPTKEANKMGIEASRHVVGNRWTPEANEKRRLAQLGKPKGHGAKISATKQAKKHKNISDTMSELFGKLTANMPRND